VALTCGRQSKEAPDGHIVHDDRNVVLLVLLGVLAGVLDLTITDVEPEHVQHLADCCWTNRATSLLIDLGC
jgi:hypothetical protein